MSEPIQSIAQNNYILATQQEVSHDNTLSGNGTDDSPLGVAGVPLDLIVTTEEIVGDYTVNREDVQVQGTFSKNGYKPIAWTWKFGFAGSLNFNQENTKINDDNSLYFQGYIKRVFNSGDMKIKFKLLITWIKV